MAPRKAPKERTYPAPEPNPETKRFWEAAAQGQLLIKKCQACGEVHYYPRALCPFCGSDRTDWQPASGRGRLPFNTDGGGLCNNHPANRGGMTKVIEAVRQLRGEAHPAVQVKNCDVALAHGTGGSLGTRHGSATVILERE